MMTGLTEVTYISITKNNEKAIVVMSIVSALIHFCSLVMKAIKENE